ncbi:uncharacterized protein ACHE_50169A [Aspergillus chevalieri]|uniref:HTH araC/xylS-type domain-containing protein n=1 Tax=Aspergillus chevalieri TaxID=182096 RepID=A0A7R7ZPR2_ASPCH|nr:uncharacterized protein ACHE_50169A [Aspergillus chevalieri]BCR88971.1 hypothetical protein ACHE_50169A [Aspergillus chevalieri]
MCAHFPTHLEHVNPQKIAAQWRAVANRDASVNSFVYAVRTTGIYCRPSCPARLARRANVDFFNSPTLAEAAGFRPCKRCRPNDQMGDPQVRLVQAACDSIAAAVSSGGKVKLEELAEAANFTPSHFHRVFKKITGVTPGQYAKEQHQQGFNGGESNGNLEHDRVPGAPDEDRFFNELIDWDANA